jgi:DNA-binding GntR family transcriptional regulator
MLCVILSDGTDTWKRTMHGMTTDGNSIQATDGQLSAKAAMATGVTANARAYKALKEAVHSSTFESGEILTLRRLTKMLGFGAMPVREAIKRLISEGAFEGLPNRSARVPVLGRREIQQIADLRYLLEPNAAALAAENITVHQIAELQRMHDAMIACVTARDYQGYKTWDTAFHFEIYRIADNKPLANLIDALWLRMAPFTSRWLHRMVDDPASFDRLATCHHGLLLAAFQQRDAEAARLAMQLDLAASKKTRQYQEAMTL